MNDIDYDTELSSYYIVQLIKNNVIELECVWGIIELDKKRRFNKDDYVCTTQIISNDNYHIKTANTVYKVNNLIETIQLPLTAEVVTQLRSGINPSIFK